MEAKLNRKKNASVNENAHTTTSMINIDQRGKLFFQKKSKSLYIPHKIKQLIGIT
jgi:hypothetical protein